MMVDIDLPDDGQCHRYCWVCRAETVKPVAGRPGFRCATCGSVSGRALVIDPAVRWWVDASGEYWHASAGVFVRRGDGLYLFFERVFFPQEWTVPAGHVDAGEDPVGAAVRELEEEVGLSADPGQLLPLGVDDVLGDSCWRGSDAHRWHAFRVELSHAGDVQVAEEGRRPVWLPLEDALKQMLTVPVRCAIERYRGNGLD